MTDAGWAAGKDIKEPGWYWWDEKGLPIKAVQIEKGFTFSKYAGIGRDVMYVVGYGGLLEDKPGRFLGPISPDTYHQGRVAGLKCVRRKITDFGECAFTDCEEDLDDLTKWLDFQLKQQAQGGVLSD